MSKVLLFVPSEARKLAKIVSLEAPAFMIDLEDGVAVGLKDEARQLLQQSAAQLYAQKPCWVRVNSQETPFFFHDMNSAIRPGLLGINLPKVESALQLQIADWYLGQLEGLQGIARGSIQLMATIETARGLENVLEIARATPRLACLCFGNADYSRDLGLDWPAPDGGLYPAVTAAKIRLVQVSAWAGLEPPHDGASADFRDLGVVEEEAEAARQLGFAGKHAIHPAQVPVLERVFRPSQSQIDWARRVLDYHQSFPEQGAYQIDGRMVDAPVILRAQQILDRSE